MIYIGIDPGASGGLAAICDGKLRVRPMPKTLLDAWFWFSQFSSSKGEKLQVTAVVEKVGAMPQQGVSSVFTFGRGYGNLEAFLTAARIPFEAVPPQKWQKALNIPPRDHGEKIQVRNKKGKLVTKRRGEESKAHFKNRLRAHAQKLYPKLKIWKKPKTKGRQLAIADAILIATYCRRMQTGK